MAKISSFRKGTELDPRVFGTWQEQVSRALRALAEEFVTTVSINFATVSAGGNVTKTVAIAGAESGAAVVVTPGTAPGAMLFDGYVSSIGIVTVRATNPTTGAIAVPSASYRVMVFNS